MATAAKKTTTSSRADDLRRRLAPDAERETLSPAEIAAYKQSFVDERKGHVIPFDAIRPMLQRG